MKSKCIITVVFAQDTSNFIRRKVTNQILFLHRIAKRSQNPNIQILFFAKRNFMNQSQIVALILKAFDEQNAKIDHLLNVGKYHAIFRSLNPKEQDLFEPAVNQLIEDGLVYRGGSQQESIALTQVGFDRVYTVDQAKAILKIRAIIMRHFEDRRCKANHVVTIGMANNIFRTLNPKEEVLIDTAIEELVNEELILSKDLPGQYQFTLTEKGYATLYN